MKKGDKVTVNHPPTRLHGMTGTLVDQVTVDLAWEGKSQLWKVDINGHIQPLPESWLEKTK